MKRVLLFRAQGELGQVIIRKLQNNGCQPVVLNADLNPDQLEGICDNVDCVVSISDPSSNRNGQYKHSDNVQVSILREAIKSRVSEFIFISMGLTYSAQRLAQKLNRNLKLTGMKFSIVYPNHAVWDGVNKSYIS